MQTWHHVFVLSLILAPLSSSATAQTLRPDMWITDGGVYNVIRSGNTIYVGGRFTAVGPATGALVTFDPSADKALKPYPGVVGNVNAVAADGHGGVYIGGRFTLVQGEPRNNLAHLDANGSLASWNPNPSSDIYSIVVVNDTVYVGGFFSSIGGQLRLNLAALDPVTGDATSWNPNVDNVVNAILVNGTTMYLGGLFTNVGGQPRNCLAAIDISTGAVTGWNPNVVASGFDTANIRALALSGSTIYVGGVFSNVGGQARKSLAAINAITGLATSWSPDPFRSINSSSYVFAITVNGSTVYVGGLFDSIGGQPRIGLAGIDAVSGLATSWNPMTTMDSVVHDFVLDGGTLYVMGSFTSMGGQPRQNLAAVSTTTALATSWNPNLASQGIVLREANGKLYVGGQFNIGTDFTSRNNLAAFDATTGEATSFNPNVTAYFPASNNTVYDMALDGSTLYIGGYFNMVGGEFRCGLASVDAVTGTVTSWDPKPITEDCTSVSQLEVGNGQVYIVGDFTTLGGQLRNGTGAVDKVTGAVTAWNPDPDGGPAYLLVSGNTVFAAGSFTSIGGKHRIGLAALDGTTGQGTNWNPRVDANGGVWTLALRGTTLYAGGYFTSIGGQNRNGLAALSVTTGDATSWNPNPDGGVNGIGVNGNTIYLGGDFMNVGGQPHNHLAAVDATTGQATLWHPNPNGPATSFAFGPSTMYTGGDFSTMSQEPFVGFASFSLASPVGIDQPVNTPSLRIRSTPNPFRGSVALEFVLPEKENVEADVYDLAGRLVRHLFVGELPAGEQSLIWDGRNNAGREASRGLYVARVQAGALILNAKVLRLQ